ncbi:MAG: PorP/SprF family type IX secretion system membrane protein [Odoribacter splanchnicus]|jgi:bacteroidetes-specific putative membrane protein
MRFVIAGLLVFVTTWSSWGQSNVLRFTDYNMVQPVINPACMGINGGVNGLLLYRSRFEKSDYWPSTGVFNLNSMIENKNLGGGINLVFDKYGPYEKLNAYLAGTYRLKVNEGKYLFFGLQAGINYVTNSGDYKKYDEAEVIFNDNYSQPNFGFGLHFQADRYFFGVSIPEFRYNTIDEEGNKVNSMMSDMLKMFAYGGYRFKVGKNVDFEPYSYLTYSGEESATWDLGLRMIYRDCLIFGAQYRTEEAFAVMLRIKLFDDLWLGYSFEGNNSDIDNNFNSVQEIGLTFRFGKKGKKSGTSATEDRFNDINSIRYF